MISLEIGGFLDFWRIFHFPPSFPGKNLFPIVSVIIYGHSDLIAIKILEKKFWPKILDRDPLQKKASLEKSRDKN